MPLCPECRDGKHRNCTGEALDETNDEIVDCGCLCAIAQNKRIASAIVEMGGEP